MGRPPRNSAADVCRVIALHPEPVVASGDIHDELDLTQDGALDRLHTLADEGYLNNKRVGSSGMVFWLTDKGRKALNDVV